MDYIEYLIDEGADLESTVIGYGSYNHNNKNKKFI